jgi:hypothetical protein
MKDIYRRNERRETFGCMNVNAGLDDDTAREFGIVLAYFVFVVLYPFSG